MPYTKIQDPAFFLKLHDMHIVTARAIVYFDHIDMHIAREEVMRVKA